MAGILKHRTSRSVAFWTLAASTLVLQVVVTAITIRLATKILVTTHVHNVALTASALNICAIAALLLRLALCFSRNAHGLLAVLTSSLIILPLAAALLTIYTFGWTLTNPDDARGLASAGIVMWTLAFILQICFYATLLWPSGQLGGVPPGEPMTERQSPPRAGKRSLSIHLASLAPVKVRSARSDPVIPSPKDTGLTHSPRSPVRHSVHQALRPMTSRTRLLLRNSFASTDIPSVPSLRPTSFDTTHHNDGFETWDTSAVEDVAPSHDVQKTTWSKLEPIPGSRPVSPAKPLDGPFPHRPSTPEATPLPASPALSPVTSPGPNTSSPSALPLPPLRRPSTNQSHIHPLFRPESPIPPPLASPGTVIVASPYAGQVVSPEHALSPRALSSAQGSRPGSATPLSPTESRPGSSRGFRMNSSASVEPPLPSPLREG